MIRQQHWSCPAIIICEIGRLVSVLDEKIDCSEQALDWMFTFSKLKIKDDQKKTRKRKQKHTTRENNNIDHHHHYYYSSFNHFLDFSSKLIKELKIIISKNVVNQYSFEYDADDDDVSADGSHFYYTDAEKVFW
jgi:hypothetical protein